MSSFDNDINIGEVSSGLGPEDVSSEQSAGFFSKLALMILLIIFVVFSVKFSIQLILYLMSPSNSPTIIDGRIDGTESHSFTQNPGLSKSKTIQRSKNEKDGLEFTWSTWLFIKESGIESSTDTKYKHIFSKGDGASNVWVEPSVAVPGDDNMNNGMIWPNASPALYLRSTPTTDSNGAGNHVQLRVAMTTFGSDDATLPIVETIDIDNIPLEKWINIIIRVKGLIVDVYLNGIIVKRHILQSTPKQNYGDVHTGLNGGFNGYISCLRYFDYAIEVGKISSIIDQGPTLKMLSNQGNKKNQMPYMSSRWYFNY
jgi:hypothetical protein